MIISKFDLLVWKAGVVGVLVISGYLVFSCSPSDMALSVQMLELETGFFYLYGFTNRWMLVTYGSKSAEWSACIMVISHIPFIVAAVDGLRLPMKLVDMCSGVISSKAWGQISARGTKFLEVSGSYGSTGSPKILKKFLSTFLGVGWPHDSPQLTPLDMCC